MIDYKKALEEMKNNTPKTALEWYEREMFKTGFVQHLDIFNEIYKIAKQMEKQQIEKAIDDALNAYGIIKNLKND
jgi:hypothetical protein